MTRVETLQEVFAEREQKNWELQDKYPWVPILFNWIVAAVIIALAVSFVLWGIDIKIRNTAKALTADAIATKEAEQKAVADAEAAEKAAIAASEEECIKAEALDCAKALYGIRLFVEKYHYADADKMTYLRSAFNRVDALGVEDNVDRRDKLHDVLSGGQYLAYNENSVPLTEDKELALKAVREWHNEDTKPVDSSYQFAELLEDGVWLKNDLNASGYVRRWRAS